MTIETALWWSICRSLLVSTIALPLAAILWQLCSAGSGRSIQKRLLAFGAILPLFVPDLLVGFTYRLTSTRLVHSVAATEALYAALLLIRIVSLQVAVRLVLPASSVTIESLHSWKMQQSPTPGWWLTWLRMQILGPLRRPLAAWLAGCLLCFQDFETAALLQIDRHPIAWTVWLFDAHAAGEPLRNSLRFVSEGLILQAAILVPAIFLLNASQKSTEGLNTASNTKPNGARKRAINVIALLLLTGSLITVAGWPAISNGGSIADGFLTLWRQNTLQPRSKQIAASLITSITAAALALSISRWLCELKSRVLVIAFLLPGLCGSLFVSLTMLAIFQLPGVNKAYDTWLPMILGQSVLIMPRAWLLVTLLNVNSNSGTLHSAKLLGNATYHKSQQMAHAILWRLQHRRWVLVIAILSHWCLWDVTIASTLRPVTFEPIVTRLYNEMHYNRTETLVALTVLTIATPFIAYLLIGSVWKRTSLLRGTDA
ncbi:MAG: hypothetical protein WAO83_21530 [Fuerstiella sp.]